MGERVIHAEQWTRIFPVPFLSAITPSAIFASEMEDETESRWYIMPSTLMDGFAPIRTWVRVKNSWDEAAEHSEKLDPLLVLYLNVLSHPTIGVSKTSSAFCKRYWQTPVTTNLVNSIGHVLTQHLASLNHVQETSQRSKDISSITKLR